MDANGAVAKIKSAIVGPYDQKRNVRLPAYPPHGLTSIVGTNLDLTIESSAISAEKRLFLFPDPVWPLWADQLNTSLAGGTAEFTVTYKTDNVTEVTSAYLNVHGITYDSHREWQGALGATSTEYPGVFNATVLYNDYGFGGRYLWPSMVDINCGHEPFYWMPGSAGPAHNVAVNIWVPGPYMGTSVVNNNTASIELEYWTAPGEVSSRTIDLGGTTLTPSTLVTFPGTMGVTCPSAALLGNGQSRFIRIRSVAFAQDGVARNTTTGSPLYVSMTMGIGTLSPTVAIVMGYPCSVNVVAPAVAANTLMPIKGAYPSGVMDATTIPFENVLLHSVSLSLENSTKVINKEGTLVAGSLDHSRQYFPDWVVSTPQRIASQRRYLGAAEHGIRTWIPFSPASGGARNCLMTTDITEVATSTLRTQMRSGDIYTCIVIKDDDFATVSSFTARLSLEWEYLNTNPIFGVGVTRFVTPSLEMACTQLSMMPNFRRFERDGTTIATTRGRVRGPRKPKAKQEGKPKPKPKAQKSKEPKPAASKKE